MKIIQLKLVSLGVVLFVAGCGGGGGTSGGIDIPTAAVQITPANAPAIATSSIAPAQGMTQTGSGMPGVVGIVAQNSGHTRSVLEIALAEFNRARNLKFSQSVAGAVSSVTLNCTGGGTVTGTIQDIDSSNSFTVGDILKMVFHNCVEIGGTSNGSVTFVITAANGPLLGQANPTVLNPLNVAFTLTFSNFSSRDNVTNLTDTISGGINFSFSDDGTNTNGTMSGTSLRMDISGIGAFLMTNYSISFTEHSVSPLTSPYSFSVNMTVASTIANGSVTIVTTVPFAGVGTAEATVGEMVISGANNSTLTLTANADGIHVGIVLDEDGAGGPTAPITIINPATGADYTWAEL